MNKKAHSAKKNHPWSYSKQARRDMILKSKYIITYDIDTCEKEILTMLRAVGNYLADNATKLLSKKSKQATWIYSGKKV